MILKVLGTQSPYNTLGHNCPGFLIIDGETKIMLDCGSGSHSLLSFPEDLKNLFVIISHLHRDHYNDIFNLQYASYVFHEQGRLEKPINIYLPCTPDSNSYDVIKEPISFAKCSTYGESFQLHIGKFLFMFCKTHHPVETYAVKLYNGDKKIVYTSDTSFSCKEKLVRFSKGADLLICESSLLVSYGLPESSVHLTAKQAGIIAREAKVKQLMLTHFWPEESPEKYVIEARTEFKNVVAANEGDVLFL